MEEDNNLFEVAINDLEEENYNLEKKLKQHCVTLDSEHEQLMNVIQLRTKEMRQLKERNELMIHEIEDMKEQTVT